MSHEKILQIIYMVALLILIWPGYRAYSRGQTVSSILLQIGLWVIIALLAAFLYIILGDYRPF